MTLTEDDKAALRQKHGPAAFHEEDGAVFVFRKPKRAAWARYMNSLADDKKRDFVAATEQLCIDTLVEPIGTDGKADYTGLRALFEDSTAASQVIAEQLGELARGGASGKV